MRLPGVQTTWAVISGGLAMSSGPRFSCLILLGFLVVPVLLADELITNGGFEEGNKGFRSQLPYSPNSVLDAPSYAIAKDPQKVHRDAASFVDRSGDGSMLVLNVNGGRNGKHVVWSQTANVVSDSEYLFSFWVAQWYSIGDAELDVQVNGQSVGKVSSGRTTGSWREFTVKWKSGEAKSAEIEIICMTRSNVAIDDISLQGASALPGDVLDQIRAFEADAREIQQKADAKIKARRQQLIRDLQVLQDTYTKAGKLDEAVGIRDRIQQLKAQTKTETKD
jgi:hypothetical protein